MYKNMYVVSMSKNEIPTAPELHLTNGPIAFELKIKKSPDEHVSLLCWLR